MPDLEQRPIVGPFTRRQLATLAAVIAIVTLVLVVVTRPLSGTNRIVSATAGAGPTFFRVGEPTSGLQIGDVAPDFAAADGTNPITDLDGRPVTLAGLRGRPVWVLFWATWCPPCQTETPDIQRTWDEYMSAGLAVVAVDVQEPAEIVKDYAQTYGLTYPIAIDPTASMMKSYAVFGLPTHYFIDRDGIVQDRYFGILNGEQMKQRVGAFFGTGPR